MSAKFVGSQIQLVFQVDYATFTPDQFNQTLKEKGFQITPVQAIGPQGQATPIQTFSKGNLIIFFVMNPLNPSQIQIVFRVLNTVSLMSGPRGGMLMQDIKDILAGFNVVEDVISLVSFNCITKAVATFDPTKGLTAGVKPALLKKTTKALGANLKVTSLRLGTDFPLQTGMQLTLEPLSSDPTKQFFINVVYQTKDMKELDTFIRGFGENTIQDIVGALVNE